MTIALRNIRVFDGQGQVLERSTLLIKNKHIAAIGPAGEVPVPRGSHVIDGRGLTVLPGLMDCHLHLGLGAEPDVVTTVTAEPSSLTLLKATRYAQQTLEAGFTTVRDLGFRDHSIFSLKQAVDSGLMPGPRILSAGLAICMTGGHARFIGREADGPVEVVAAVREQLAAGADLIKVIASGGILTPGTSPDQAQMTLEELSAAVDEARRAGRRVAAHAHGASGMKNAIRAGVHSIEHATLMDDDAAAMMKQRDVFMVPTLSALATTADCPAGCGVPASAITKAKAMRARHEISFKKAHQHGIAIAFGTDAGTPLNFHGDNAQELERMVAWGMSPLEAIVAATSSAARLLGIVDWVGTLAPGMQADLVVIEGNPLKQISLLRRKDRIMGVMQAGRFVSGELRT